MLLVTICCKLTCEIHVLGIRKPVLSFAQNEACSTSLPIVINRRYSFLKSCNRFTTGNQNRARILSCDAYSFQGFARYENRVVREAIWVSREGGNDLLLSGSVPVWEAVLSLPQEFLYFPSPSHQPNFVSFLPTHSVFHTRSLKIQLKKSFIHMHPTKITYSWTCSSVWLAETVINIHLLAMFKILNGIF